MPRFYLPAGSWDENPALLSPEESRHAFDVLRLKTGTRMTVFDGKGTEATARLLGRERNRAQIEIGARVRSSPLPCELTLAQGIPKGKSMDLIVQKAVELGAARVVPLLSERSVVRVGTDELARKSARWREIAIEACKQCGQNVVPEIPLPVAPIRYLATMGPVELPLIASLQPGARKIHDVLAATADDLGRLPRSAVIFVGPEGDFTPAELAAARGAGCLPVTLGPIVLRSETAAIYCLSVLAHELFG